MKDNGSSRDEDTVSENRQKIQQKILRCTVDQIIFRGQLPGNIEVHLVTVTHL
jgi:hypothetical protein